MIKQANKHTKNCQPDAKEKKKEREKVKKEKKRKYSLVLFPQKALL